MKLPDYPRGLADIESIKDNTKKFVMHLNKLEREKTRRLKKVKRPIDLRKVLLSLKKEIAILSIAKGELYSLLSQKDKLETTAWKLKAEFILYYLKHLNRIAEIATELLDNAQSDAGKIEVLLSELEGMHDEFYLEWGNEEVKARVKAIKEKIGQDMRLEQRLGKEDIDQVIRRYLDRRPDREIAKLARTGSTLSGLVIGAAIGLIILAGIKISSLNAQATKTPQRTVQVANVQTSAAPATQTRIQTSQQQRPAQPTTSQVSQPQRTNRYEHQSGDFTDDAPQVLLARVLTGETMGCNRESKEAIASLIMLRVQSPSFPDTVHGVILQRNAFASFLQSDPNYRKIQNPEIYGKAEWAENLEIAQLAIQGRLQSSIGFALHYHDSSMAQLGEPYLLVGRVPNGTPNGSFYFYVARTDKLSDNFSVSEFMCKDRCRTFQMNPILIEKLEQLRTLAGNKSISVNSGYRCPGHNRSVGGASRSQHVMGTAADIVVKNLTVPQVVRLAEQMGFGGIGTYINKGFTHVDVRPGRSRWNE